MKVTLVSPYPVVHSGGVETFVRSLEKGFVSKKVDVNVITVSERQLKLVPKQSKNLINFILRKNLEKSDLEGRILHFNAWTAYLAKYFENPSVATSHGTIVNMVCNSSSGFSFLRRNYLMKVTAKFEKQGFEACDRVAAVSKQVKQEMIRDYKIDEEKIKVINTGIKIKKPLKNFRQKLGYSKTDIVLMTSGRGDYNKGMDIMFNTAKKMNEKYKTKFLAAGNSIIKENKWFKVQKFTPNLMPSVYSSADIYLHASRYESYGLALLEAMAQGVPPVAFDVGVAEEAIEDGRNGFLIPKGNVKLFNQKVEELIVDESLRNKLGKKAKKTIEKKFNVEKMIEEYLSFYKKINFK